MTSGARERQTSSRLIITVAGFFLFALFLFQENNKQF
jgi:hypothetical protein